MKRKTFLINAITLFLFIILSSSISYAADDAYSRESLRNLEGVEVLVGIEKSTSITKLKLTKRQLRTDAELKLRLAGINVIPAEELSYSHGIPMLYIGLNIISNKDESLYVYGSRAEFTQAVTLYRENHVLHPTAITWDSVAIGFITGSSNPEETMRESLKNHIDRFINAYLSVNPKK